MNTNPELRESLILQADKSYFYLMTQLNLLFDQISFYIERYPVITIADEMRTNDINSTVKELTRLVALFAETVCEWKSGARRRLSAQEVEHFVLIEMWANVQALASFLILHDIDLEPFDHKESSKAISILFRANRLL